MSVDVLDFVCAKIYFRSFYVEKGMGDFQRIWINQKGFQVTFKMYYNS